MARSKIDISAQVSLIVADVRKGVFAPVYLLMGDESYYPELVCKAVLDNCVPEESKDFNETVCYGADVNAAQVISAARRYPMMADRQLVVVKEAQMMKDLENLSFYAASPLDSTVLVILMHKASADKRKALYKSVQKCGVIVDSPSVRDYEIQGWISSFFSSRGLSIDPPAAALLGEYAGTELSTIAVETDKLLKNLPEGTKRITESDIEKNVGISKQYTIFELNRELSAKNATKAVKLARFIGSGAHFAMPMAVSAMYPHFYKILRYGALLQKNRYPSQEEKIEVLGVNPYFVREYDMAVRNYPLPKAAAAISLLTRYDYLGKGGDGAASTQEDLLVELTLKLLNL